MIYRVALICIDFFVWTDPFINLFVLMDDRHSFADSSNGSSRNLGLHASHMTASLFDLFLTQSGFPSGLTFIESIQKEPVQSSTF